MCTSRVVYALVALLSLNERAAIAQEIDKADIAAAVTRSLTLLQASGRTWIEKSGCVSCHHQALPAVSIALARARGFRLDEEAARERVQATLARFAPSREDLFQNPLGIGIIGGGALGAGYALLGLAAADVPANATTDAMVHFILARQLPDGRFHSPDPVRLPLEGSDVTATTLGIRALQTYAPGGLKDEVAVIIHRARNWLLSIQPRGTEEKSYQLQGLGLTGADKGEIAKRVAVLLAEQRSDGGWAQLPTLSSDAYATGQALVALHQAGSVPTSSMAYRNGIKFLLRTQFEDGSWLVVSRARGTQPYLESGFPHGTNQFISAAGTAWATSALLLSLEPRSAEKAP
jgi:Prenyltransferase and squalene oxidase repeat